MPLQLFAGFFKSLEDIPAWFSWIQYVSPFKYGYEMLVVNEFAGLPIVCNVGPSCSIDNGDQLLAYLGLEQQDIWISAFALACITLLWHCIGCSFLHFWYATGGEQHHVHGLAAPIDVVWRR